MKTPDQNIGGNQETPEDNLEEMYGASHADFHNRLAGLKSKEEAILLKDEIENDEKLTEMGKEDLKNDLEIMWKI